MVTQCRLNTCMLKVATALMLTLWAAVGGAQPEVSEARLRDALLEHFGQDNLLPVFLPRDQRVGDVLQPGGAFFARQATCFPALKVEARKPSDSLKTVVIDIKSEGNFGIGIKRLVDFFAKAGARSATKLAVSFIDETYTSATTLDLRNNYSEKNCPMLANMVGNRLAGGNLIPLLFQPGVDRPLFHAVAHLGHADFCHTLSSMPGRVLPQR